MDKCLESNQKEKLIKENLIFKLVNTRYNSDYLQDAPHREIGDMSVVYCWKISDKLFGKLTNNVMEKQGWTEEMLYEMAYKNTREMNPPVLESIYEAIVQHGIQAMRKKSEQKERWFLRIRVRIMERS